MYVRALIRGNMPLSVNGMRGDVLINTWFHTVKAHEIGVDPLHYSMQGDIFMGINLKRFVNATKHFSFNWNQG